MFPTDQQLFSTQRITCTLKYQCQKTNMKSVVDLFCFKILLRSLFCPSCRPLCSGWDLFRYERGANRSAITPWEWSWLAAAWQEGANPNSQPIAVLTPSLPSWSPGAKLRCLPTAGANSSHPSLNLPPLATRTPNNVRPMPRLMCILHLPLPPAKSPLSILMSMRSRCTCVYLLLPPILRPTEHDSQPEQMGSPPPPLHRTLTLPKSKLAYWFGWIGECEECKLA